MTRCDTLFERKFVDIRISPISDIMGKMRKTGEPTEMKKILLCSLKFSAVAHGVGPRTENLGLCYLLGYIRYHGYEGVIFDGNSMEATYDEYISGLDLSDFSIIGFSVYSTNYLATIKAVKMLRERGFRGHITMGGHYPSFNREAILERHPEIDSIVIGEGEEPLLGLARSTGGGEDFRAINGLCYLRDGAVCYNPPAHLIESLDFPFFPDRSCYEDSIRKINFATLTSSRGCWGSCSFCSVRNFYRLCSGEPWRYRSPGHIVDELEDLNKRLGVTNFAFFDDNFIGPGRKGRERARQIAGEILGRKLDIVFSLECRPDDVDEELFRILKQAGLVKVSLGIESFVPRQQELYNKVIDVRKISRAVSLFESLDFLCSLYMIMFDPFVTFQELLLNFEHIGSLGASHFRSFTGFLQVFSGIPLYPEFEKKGLLESHEITHTGINEFWLHYKFRDDRIETLLASWIEFEEAMGFLFSRAARTIADSAAYELFKEHRDLVFQCFRASLIEGEAIIEAGELREMLKAHMGDYRKRGEALIARYTG